MKKSNIRFGIIIGILLIIYNLLVFVIPFEKNSIFWLSYGFTLDAFVIAAVSLVIAFRSGKEITSKFYGFPIAKVGLIYLLVQVILCFVFMGLSKWIPISVGVIVYAVALGFAVIGLVVTDTVRDYIESQDIKLKAEISVMRLAQAEVNKMVSICDDAESAVMIKAFAEELKYSDPVSSAATADIEKRLCEIIEELDRILVADDKTTFRQLCKEATIMLNERNRLCKQYKR